MRKGKPAHEMSPVALEAVARIDALFEIERGINGMSVEERLAARQQHARPLVEELHDWFMAQRSQMSKHNPVAKAISYMFEKEGRLDAFTRFLDDGRLYLSNDAAERALRGIALGRRAWLFAGSQRGGERAALMYSLIVSARNVIDPQAWLANVLARCPAFQYQGCRNYCRGAGPPEAPGGWRPDGTPDAYLHDRICRHADR